MRELLPGKEIAKGHRLYMTMVKFGKPIGKYGIAQKNIVADTKKDVYKTIYELYIEKCSGNVDSISVDDVTNWSFEPNIIEETDRYYDRIVKEFCQ